MTPRKVDGPLVARHLADGLWQLSAGNPPAVALYVRTGPGDVAPGFDGRELLSVVIAWHSGGVTLTLRTTRGAEQFEARTAIIHEPRPRLYEGLPLAGYDPKAQRFWSRIFCLLRVPGGRLLLRYIARRSR